MKFEDMIVGHLEWIARLALHYRKDMDEAADLAQDTLLRLWSQRDKYDKRHDFKPWVKCVMHNIAYTQWQHDSRISSFSLDTWSDPPDDSNAESRLLVSDMMRSIRIAEDMTVGVESVMLYADGYAYDEIADITGVGVGTVKSRISNGRKLLAKLLGC